MKNLKRKYRGKCKLFLDLHGHSSQPNTFCYGPPHDVDSENYFLSRLLPELIAKKNSNFSLKQSSYSINPDKKFAARSMFFNSFNIPFTYTIETTFGVFKDKPAEVADFLQIGADIAECSFDFLFFYYLKLKKDEVGEQFAE